MRKTWNAGRSGGYRPTATAVIVGAIVFCFLGGWLLSSNPDNPFWKFLPYNPEAMPWTLFTYPFALFAGQVFWFALACFITYQFLSDLERRLGPYGAALLFFAYTFLGGLCYFLATLVFGPGGRIPTLNLPLELIVFTWCLVNPASQIMLMFVIPVPTKVLMWLCVAAIVIEYGWSNPPVGFVTALPLLFAWPYATNRIPWLRFGEVPDLASRKVEKKKDESFGRFMDDVKRREHERAEKERLRKLFESSLSDDDKDQGQP